MTEGRGQSGLFYCIERGQLRGPLGHCLRQQDGAIAARTYRFDAYQSGEHRLGDPIDFTARGFEGRGVGCRGRVALTPLRKERVLHFLARGELVAEERFGEGGIHAEVGRKLHQAIEENGFALRVVDRLFVMPLPLRDAAGQGQSRRGKRDDIEHQALAQGVVGCRLCRGRQDGQGQEKRQGNATERQA